MATAGSDPSLSGAERLERQRLKWEKENPKCCPQCGGKKLACNVEVWFAHSLDPHDLHNTAELNEHQCADCAHSFWM